MLVGDDDDDVKRCTNINFSALFRSIIHIHVPPSRVRGNRISEFRVMKIRNNTTVNVEMFIWEFT